MELIDTRARIATVAERWKTQYFSTGRWFDIVRGRSEDIYNRLRLLPNDATVDDVQAIMGNRSWVEEDCTECDEPAVILLGQQPDYDSNTVWLCAECLNKAVALVQPTVELKR